MFVHSWKRHMRFCIKSPEVWRGTNSVVSFKCSSFRIGHLQKRVLSDMSQSPFLNLLNISLYIRTFTVSIYSVAVLHIWNSYTWRCNCCNGYLRWKYTLWHDFIILDEVDCISHSAITLEKGRNPFIFPPAMRKYKGGLDILTLIRLPV